MEIDYKSIGMRVNRFREDLGYSQERLSELSGVDNSNISHIERGATKPSLPTLVKLANALDVSMDDLICDSIPAARGAYERMAASILADCSHRELQIITETLLALREVLRNKDV